MKTKVSPLDFSNININQCLSSVQITELTHEYNQHIGGPTEGEVCARPISDLETLKDEFIHIERLRDLEPANKLVSAAQYRQEGMYHG